MTTESKPLIPLPTPTAEQLESLKTWDPRVRVRALIEQGIMRKTLEVLTAAGYRVTVNDGEEDVYQQGGPSDIEPMMATCFSADEEVLFVYEAALGSKPFGWIKFIYGNTGWDVMSDHSVNLEDVLKPANEYAEAMSEWC